ncbi:NYN domain-containing protein [Colwelliaceae bacterium BS250]
MPTTKLQVALFIDADNASAKHINNVTTTLARYGTLTSLKAFGNWEKPHLKSWTKQLNKHAIQPVQQFDVTKQKNATDIALTIDVIDTIHNDNIDVFAIMSSDADFTPVVERLRSAGKIVIGFGDNHANKGFKNACTEFVVVGRKPKILRVKSNRPDCLLNTVKLAIQTCSDIHGRVNFADIERLLSKTPTFPTSSYNKMQLTQLLIKVNGVELL